MNKARILLSVAIVASLLAGAANAAVVNIAGVSAMWTSASPNLASGVGTKSINWGTAASSAGKSGYDFNAAAPTSHVAQNSPFDLGEFVHRNNPLYTYPHKSESIKQATLQVAIKLLIGHTERILTTSYVFNHLESPNTPKKGAKCANGKARGSGVNVNGCADHVTTKIIGGKTKTFMVGNDEYIFTFEGFKIGDKLFSQFWTKEKANNAATLQGSYKVKTCANKAQSCMPPHQVSPVPLPAAGWMLLAGLGGLAAAARKRKAS